MIQTSHLLFVGLQETTLDEGCDRLKAMPEGAERDELMRLTANQMKRDLIQGGHGSMDDEKVADDMARLTDGAVQLDLQNFTFERFNPQASGGNQQQSSKRKKKK